MILQTITHPTFQSRKHKENLNISNKPIYQFRINQNKLSYRCYSIVQIQYERLNKSAKECRFAKVSLLNMSNVVCSLFENIFKFT